MYIYNWLYLNVFHLSNQQCLSYLPTIFLVKYIYILDICFFETYKRS